MQLAAGSAFAHLRDALAWRVRDLVGDQRVDRAIVRIAGRWRPLLGKPVFIGIAGSAGKTTTKELLARVLSRRGRCVASPGSLNMLPEIAKTILRVRPTHDFCVAEMSEDRPGILDEPLALLQPGIGILTVVGNDHWSAYGSREAIVSELGKLVACLPATGTAVLNADDELIRALAARSAARVITYGTAPTAELRATEISSAWPERLRLTVVRGTERVHIDTGLCGAHWTSSVLAAIGGGIAAGLSLGECAEGIANLPPFTGRMQPVSTPEGVTFIRDDWKAPLWTVDACFDFLAAAQAERKIIVIGTLSDCGAGAPEKYVKVAKRAQEIADVTIFVGPWASQVLKARKPGNDEALRAFRNVRDAAEYLRLHARKGDLVLLKGTNKQDHLLRIVMARDGSIACWRDDCERHSFCTECPDHTRPSGLPVLMGDASPAGATPGVPATGQRAVEPDEQVIVGLGNPESRYAATPHNIGYEVVERLAATLGLTWDESPDALIARGSAKGRPVCLVKVRTAMNRTGAGLKRLSETMGFGPAQCVLVHDDLDMPLGSVRARLSGGAGGHRGVASILEAFQSDAFRRVKVGVGQAGAKVDRVAYVLTAFDAASRATVDQAVSTAGARAVEMIERHGAVGSP